MAGGLHPELLILCLADRAHRDQVGPGPNNYLNCGHQLPSLEGPISSGDNLLQQQNCEEKL